MMNAVPVPDAFELDIPGEQVLEGDLPTALAVGPGRRRVDRILAITVTFGPPVFTALALGLHLSGALVAGLPEVVGLVLVWSLAVVGVELGFHRLFTHRSYKASRGVQIALAVMGSMAFQGPVIWWCSIHRKHHRHSDRPGDPHSIYIAPDSETYRRGLVAWGWGFVHAHVGWIWQPASIRSPGWGGYVRDLYRDRALLIIHMRYLYWLAAGFLIPAILSGLWRWSWEGLILGALWGGFVRVFCMNHLTYWSINSLSHSVGARPYETADKSSNSIPVLFAIPTLGQSWHNNHHAFPSAARMDHRWWQLDLGAWILLALKAAGLVWDMKEPSPRGLELKRRAPGVEGRDLELARGWRSGAESPGNEGASHV